MFVVDMGIARLFLEVGFFSLFFFLNFQWGKKILYYYENV